MSGKRSSRWNDELSVETLTMDTKPNAWLARLLVPLAVGFVVLLVVIVLLSRAFGATNVEVRVASPAPAFSLRVEHGREIKLADFKNKALIVCFLAAGDKPSEKQMSILNGLVKEYDETNLAVLGVTFEQSGAQPIKSYAEGQGFSLNLYPATYEVVQAFGGLTAVPTLFVIDKNQNIIQKYVGITESNALNTDLKAVLKQ